MEKPRELSMEVRKNLSEHIETEPVLSFLPELLDRLPGAEVYLVGGAVRDHELGRHSSKDYDFVVRSAGLDEITEVLEDKGKVDYVGRNFGVLRFMPEGFRNVEPVDIAWPRTETAGGSGGYKDFDVQSDPDLSIERDLARRDFTMNAIAWNVREREYADPYGGLQDIKDRTIRAVGDPKERFREDYSRMLRCVRLACELDFEIEKGTWEAAKSMMAHINDKRLVETEGGTKEEYVVPREMVAKNLVKAFAADPGRALALFEESGALFRLLPELKSLKECRQSPKEHSEGDVWTHTKLAISKLKGPGFREMFPGEKPSVETVFAVLFHDMAKPGTASGESGRLTFYGHEKVGDKMTHDIARRLRLSSVSGHDIDEERLGWLVHMHMLPHLVDLDTIRKSTLVKHFLEDKVRGRALLHLAFADASASIHEDGKADLSNIRRLMGALDEIEASGELEAGKVKPLVSGDVVMATLDLKPGPKIGELLDALREAQLCGEIATPEEAKEFLKQKV